MAKILQRQVGRWSKRMPDEGDVGCLIDEVAQLSAFLDNLLEYTGNWRRSWTSILEHQAQMALAFAETYQDIPGSTLPRGPVDVPVEIIDRTERLAQVQVDIKNDLANDIAFVEKAVIGPLMEARSYLKPILKYIQKRDDKKLDYEKFYKLVENYKAKPNPSRREQSILAKGELDLEEATITYRAFDDALRAQVPPLLHCFSALFPIILDAIVTVQNTFFAAAYTSIVEFAGELGFGLEHDITREWEADFLQVQQDVEQNLTLVRHGAAVRMPMQQLEVDKSLVSKIKGKSNSGIRRPAPPPAPNSRTNTSTAGSTSPTLRRPLTASRIPSTSGSHAPPSISSRKSASSVIHDPDEDDRHAAGPPRPNLATRPTLRTTASNLSLAPSDSSYHTQPHHNHRPITSTIRNHTTPSHNTQDASWIKPSQDNLRPAGAPRIYSSTSINSANVLNAALSGPSSNVSVTPSSASIAAAAKKKPPPPPPKKKKPALPKPEDQYLVALFDFPGDPSQGDLSFKVGDRIRVVKGSGKIDDWWEGECNGAKGVFPRNYTELA